MLCSSTGAVRAVYTGTRPGVSPAIRAGKGWRGRWELAPRCSATLINSARMWQVWRNTLVKSRGPYHHHHHHHHQSTNTQGRSQQWGGLSRLSLAVALVGERDVRGAGSARRRRERRLRCMLRHERQTVAMAHAEQLHHSANRVERDAALRRQTTRAREVEERELHDAPRRQKPPPPGTRPAPLVEVQPQGAMVQHCGIGFELMQSLDVPVLQMVEQPVDVDSFFRISIPAVAEQVIEVRKLALPVRAVQRAALSEPQLVEQLVEVPTVLSYSLLQQRTAEQIIDFPVPGRGGGARGGLQGLPQGQGSTASAVEQTFSQAPHRSMPRACEPRLGGLPGQGRHDECVCVVDVENGSEYFWNRLDNSTCWRLPRESSTAGASSPLAFTGMS